MRTCRPARWPAGRRMIVRSSDGTEGEAVWFYQDEVLLSEGDHGNSRLMSSCVEMRGVAGSIAARRAHNLSASPSLRCEPAIVGAAARGWSVMDDSTAPQLRSKTGSE